MKRLALVAALASLAGASAAIAQSAPPDYVPPPSTAAPAPAPSGSVPAMPSLDTNQSAEVQRQLAPYRAQIDARVARGEITADDAGRLLQWREWQIAQQVARTASRSAPVYDQAPPPDYDQAQAGDDGPPPGGQPYQGQPYQAQPYQAQPYQGQPYYGQPYYAQPYYAPYYGPYYAPPYYYAPRYYAPAPYYWGARICAGGWGHHGGARVCI